MTVPEGFSVEIVAAEPDVVNPVAMSIDEKGRFWITESLEYPRKEPGPGRDRVKVLEDTDGDGRVDKSTVFADGLNIPSGIAVGYGGVWVANSPDLLFMQDTDGDLKADKIETVVTGFGRTDTHELPNSLTWGPDGWLYGLNGVFNYSDVKYAETNPNFDPEHPGWKFTCAMFRIHPRTRKFEIFAEGTSNPWGIAINEDGEFFISACVIDHLWHIVETGYYIRQGGPYPAHTWPMESIVEHKHQKAAFCGITWFDSDAYPEEYRGVLYMGNIHGGCINADIAERHGSTYKAKPHPGFPAKPGAWDNDEYGLIRKASGGRQSPDGEDDQQPLLADFLTANDAWFMPVVQKVGPDGCLYILDWYDRYHCYQDANADPEGIERAKGRLYRVRYKDTPHAQPFDLAKKSDDELIELLGDPNVFYRETAQRLLSERSNPLTAAKLESRILDASLVDIQRMHALWARAAMPSPDPDWIARLLDSDQADDRAWGVRLATAHVEGHRSLLFDVGTLVSHRQDHTPEILRQLAVFFGKVPDDQGLTALAWIQSSATEDSLITARVWQNSRSLILEDPALFADQLGKWIAEEQPVASFLPRSVGLLCDSMTVSGENIGQLITAILAGAELSEATKAECLDALTARLRARTFSEEQQLATMAALKDVSIDNAHAQPLAVRLAVLKTIAGDKDAQRTLLAMFQDTALAVDLRRVALETLIGASDRSVLAPVAQILQSRDGNDAFRSSVVSAMGGWNEPDASRLLLEHYAELDPEIRPTAIEAMTQRAAMAIPLLHAIEAKQIDKDALNLNQIARVASFKDDDLQAMVAKVYGQVRTGQRSDRRRMIGDMDDFLHGTPGDPERGVLAFKKVCAQCHKIYGEGAEVGPDITRNGRNNWEQLLHNVFDPSAVIGPGYQARILVTDDGRVLTGLAVEESDQRVVLKIQGGKLETIPRDQIDEYKISDVSMMPEQLEKQLTPQEIADLFAYIALDKPPSDPTGKYLPGAPRHE